MTILKERARNWVQDHMTRYLETGGEDGRIWSGTRDSYATPDQLREAASKLPRSTVHQLEGADH